MICLIDSFILTSIRMNLFWRNTPAILSTTASKVNAPIIIREMESALIMPTWESSVNKSSRGLMFSVLMFDRSPARAPTLISPIPMPCKYLEKQILSRILIKVIGFEYINTTWYYFNFYIMLKNMYFDTLLRLGLLQRSHSYMYLQRKLHCSQ